MEPTESTPSSAITDPHFAQPRFVQSTGLGAPAAYLKGIVDYALIAEAVPLHANAVLALKRRMLARPGTARKFDITPRFLVGAQTQAVIFEGELYAQRTSPTDPPMESWYDCGKAPAALPQ